MRQTDEALTEAIESIELGSDTTVYAKWTEKDASAPGASPSEGDTDEKDRKYNK